jgi:predicted membrane protein
MATVLESIIALMGMSVQHLLFIFMGALAYILSKFLEQKQKSKVNKGENLRFWNDYFFEAETIISFVLTVILSIFITAAVVHEFPDVPMLTSVLGGTGAYAGASELRKWINKYRYSKVPSMSDEPKEEEKKDDQ